MSKVLVKPSLFYFFSDSITKAFKIFPSLCGRSLPPQEANVSHAVQQPKETNGWRIWGGLYNQTRWVCKNTQWVWSIQWQYVHTQVSQFQTLWNSDEDRAIQSLHCVATHAARIRCVHVRFDEEGIQATCKELFMFQYHLGSWQTAVTRGRWKTF